MTSDPRELAEELATWLKDGLDPLAFAMRLAATNRDLVDEAMRIVRKELILRDVEQEADEHFRRHGRYLNATELRELKRAGDAKRNDYKKGNSRRRDQLTALVFELGAMACSDLPAGATPAEIELQVREHLAKIATR